MTDLRGVAPRPETLVLLFVLVFAPLAFGAVEPWSRAIAESAALAGLALALRRRTSGAALRLRATPGALPLLLLLALFGAQVVPLPAGLVRALSPAAHARWAAALGAPLPWLPLSLDPLATLRELARFGACAAVYFLTVLLLARPRRLRDLTTALAAFTAALAFAAVLQRLVSPRLLLFFREAPSPNPFGPFVNRNHFANLMAMLAPVVLALYLGRAPRLSSSTIRGRITDFLGRPESGTRLLFGFAALQASASLLLTLSRGAIAAAGVGMLVLAASLAARGLARRRALGAMLLGIILAFGIGSLGWSRLAERFGGLRANPEVVDPVRAGLWRDTLHLAADFPVFGSGAGTFERLYPAYRTVPGPLAVAHPHNDHLELLAGGGVLGFGLFAWFVAAVLAAVARACRRRRDPAALSLAAGAVAGCAAFLVHGASDFNLAVDANALMFFFVLGLAVSAAHTRALGDEPGTLLERRRLPAAAAYLATAAALAVALFHGADLGARQAWRQARAGLPQAADSTQPSEGAKRSLALAGRLQPLEAAYPAALARLALHAGDGEEALRLTRRALRLQPLDGAALAQLGAIYGARGEDAAARRAFAAAVASDRVAARPAEAFGSWLLAQGDRAAGVAQLREAMARDPKRTAALIGLLVLAGLDDRAIVAAVPPRTEALLRLARYLEATGAASLATKTWQSVLALEATNAEAAAALRRASGAAR